MLKLGLVGHFEFRGGGGGKYSGVCRYAGESLGSADDRTENKGQNNYEGEKEKAERFFKKYARQHRRPSHPRHYHVTERPRGRGEGSMLGSLGSWQRVLKQAKNVSDSALEACLI